MSSLQCGVRGVASIVLVVLVTACLDRELTPLNPCLVSGVSRQVSVKNVDKVDLLFSIDNSNSMADKQNSLKDQFPQVVSVLTTGQRFPGDPQPFPPVTDLHVGVVSSDMGTTGFNLATCHADGGDDARLQFLGRGTGCAAQYPQFLSFTSTPRTDPSSGVATVTDPMTFATDVGCVALLGTGGCGYEQQLEAPFKALWPSLYKDPKTGNVVTPNPVSFLQGTGKGDVPAAQGGNLGFLRNDPVQGLSLIAVVVVTDEEDCSPKENEHLKPLNLLPPGSPYANEPDLNLRCHYHPDLSWPVLDRYQKGFQALRPGNEGLVVFAAITGVPTRLVSQDVLPDLTDDTARNAWYQTILNDSEMQEVIDPSTNPGTGSGNLTPSCIRSTPHGIEVAQPPRRIVSLAQGFGANGVVQSICQEDFGPAMESIIDIIARQLGEVCLPRKLVRQSSGKVACNVVWELPRPGTAPPDVTPTECSQRPYLLPVDSGRATTNTAGGNNCKVVQLPVQLDPNNPDDKQVPSGDGWYYDDFSPDVMKTCKASQPQRVAFSTSAKPPTGVTVKLECLNETQKYARTDEDIAPNQPEIGTPCTNASQCIVLLLDTATPDSTMFCHPDLNTCVQSCVSDTQCPPAWVCDTSKVATLNTGYCVNPTCGADVTTD